VSRARRYADGHEGRGQTPWAPAGTGRGGRIGQNPKIYHDFKTLHFQPPGSGKNKSLTVYGDYDRFLHVIITIWVTVRDQGNRLSIPANKRGRSPVNGRSQTKEDAENLITVFSVGEIRFAISVENLAEIVQLTGIAEGPAKGYVLGTVDLRGAKIPVLDLEKFFNVEAALEGHGLRSMVILKRKGGGDPEMMGTIVDRIEGVHRENELTFFPFPEIAQNGDTPVYRGMLLKEQDLILLLDAPRLMERAMTTRPAS
jgi:chemotaxis signal transduction protein